MDITAKDADIDGVSEDEGVSDVVGSGTETRKGDTDGAAARVPADLILPPDPTEVELVEEAEKEK